jgi:hypothetical protein
MHKSLRCDCGLWHACNRSLGNGIDADNCGEELGFLMQDHLGYKDNMKGLHSLFRQESWWNLISMVGSH